MTSVDTLTAWYEEVGKVRMVVWRTAVGSRAVASTSLDRGALEALAKAWTSDKPPVLGGYRVTDSWTVDHPITKSNGFYWNIDNAKTGQSMSVSIKPKMPGRPLGSSHLGPTASAAASGRNGVVVFGRAL